MISRTRFFLDKLIVVESPTKMKKIEQFLTDKEVVPDWSFGGLEAFRHLGKGGPEVAVTMATSGHFMSLTELTWEVLPNTSSFPMVGFDATSMSTSCTDGNTEKSLREIGGTNGNSTFFGKKPPFFPSRALKARFNLLWETIPGRRIHESLLTHLQDETARKKFSEIIVATDPDREGELIATHVYQLMQKVLPGLSIPFTRAYMHSLTVEGVQAAMRERSTSFDWNLAHAAEARHAMDRIFGFLGSTVVRHAHPLMRSIGRVQTPSLILIREREEKIKDFKGSHPSYYEIIGNCSFKSGKHKYVQTVVLHPEENSKEAALLLESREKRVEMQKLLDSWGLGKELKELHVWEVPRVTETTSEPPDPFTMSALLTRANRLFHFSSGRISLALQELFQHGFITYPRTDSIRIDAKALEAIYKVVVKEFGEKWLQKRKVEQVQGRKGGMIANKSISDTKAEDSVTPTRDSTSTSTFRNVEDAHEAIRLTNINLTAKKLPSTLSAPAQQLYDLIRRHTLASCMIPMKIEKVQVPLRGKTVSGILLSFKLEGRHTTCEGWSKALTAGWKKGKGKGSQRGVGGGTGNAFSEAEGDSNAHNGEGSATSNASTFAMEEISDENTEESQEEQTPVISNAEFQALMRLPQMAKSSGSGNSNSSDSEAVSLTRPLQITLSAVKLREFTPPPPLLYSEGSLIADLRKHGVGRPSTYPLIVQTLLDRKYIFLNKQSRCETTEVGKLLVDVSRGIFPSIVDIGFTAKFEKQLDTIAKPDKQLEEAGAERGNDSSLEMPLGLDAAPHTNSTVLNPQTNPTFTSRASASGTNSSLPLSPMDRVLSQFTSDFLYYVLDATRQQRAHLAERSLHVLSTSNFVDSEAGQKAVGSHPGDIKSESSTTPTNTTATTTSPPPTAESIQRERERAMSLVPDLVQLSGQYKTFTAVQSNLREYLWRNFPRPSTTASGIPLPPIPKTSTSGKRKQEKRSSGKKRKTARNSKKPTGKIPKRERKKTSVGE